MGIGVLGTGTVGRTLASARLRNRLASAPPRAADNAARIPYPPSRMTHVLALSLLLLLPR